jgi:hypothetical protein
MATAISSRNVEAGPWLRVICHAAMGIGIVLACACARRSVQPKPTASAAWQQQRVQAYETSVMPQATVRVKSGDLITRLGSDITSHMLRQLNQTNKSYSHCGIASVEKDTIFVYHAIGGEFNPDQKMKREPLNSFGHPTENKAIAIFRPHLNPRQAITLQKMVKGLYHAGVPFDMDFDYNSNDKLYCAELVAKCMAIALNNPNWMRMTTLGNFRYVSVDDLFLSPIMQPKGSWQY